MLQVYKTNVYSSEGFSVKIVSVDIFLRISSKLVFLMIMVQKGPLDIPKDIVPFQCSLRNYSSAVYHLIDLLPWYDNGD